jgi:hypothetical protein
MPSTGVSGVVNFLPIALLVAVLAAFWWRRQRVRQKQLQGVLWLQAMRVLLGHIQRHRGLSAGILGGERRLLGQLDDVQQAVSRDLIHIAQVGDWVKDNLSWQAVTAHWAKLAGRYASLGHVNNIEQHNRLIKNILVFIDDVALEHHLGQPIGGKPCAWRELLAVAEWVGQLRALGTAMAAGGAHFEYAGKSRVEVSQLLVAIEAAAPQLPLSTDEQADLAALLAYVRSTLLGVQPQVKAEDFFARVSLSLDGLFGAFDRALGQVRRTLATAAQDGH